MTSPANVYQVSIDPDLARRLRVAGKKADGWRERRDELIREAANNGGTLREIAACVGLSNPGVLRIIRRIETEHITAASGGEDQPDNLVVLTPEENTDE